MRIQRRRSGNDDVTADCIASNVGRLTLLAKSDASTGELQPRRRFRAIASPLMAFIAAATGTSTVGQARSSASYAARRTTGSGSVASPRTAGIGSTLVIAGEPFEVAVTATVTMTATGAAIFSAVNRYDSAFGIRVLRRISDFDAA